MKELTVSQLVEMLNESRDRGLKPYLKSHTKVNGKPTITILFDE